MIAIVSFEESSFASCSYSSQARLREHLQLICDLHCDLYHLHLSLLRRTKPVAVVTTFCFGLTLQGEQRLSICCLSLCYFRDYLDSQASKILVVPQLGYLCLLV